MRKSLKLGFLFASVLFSHASFAEKIKLNFQTVDISNPQIDLKDSRLNDEKYMSIGEVTQEEVPVTKEDLAAAQKHQKEAKAKALSKETIPPFVIGGDGDDDDEDTDGETRRPGRGGKLGEMIKVAEDLIALGEKFYKLVEKGRPVLDEKLVAMSVLPKEDNPRQAFDEMENWSNPVARAYEVKYKNLYGSQVVYFKYLAQFQHGGTYNEKGKYLTGVIITPVKIDVAFAYTFKADSKMVSITNHAKKADPIAGTAVELKYQASTLIKHIQSAANMHFRGDAKYVVVQPIK